MSRNLKANITALMVIAIAAGPATAQRPVDHEFRYPVTDPGYPPGSGPVVCVDEGHQNHHTMAGSYAPFATLLRDDGYRVQRAVGPFTADTLLECDIVVIANPLSEGDQQRQGQYPHEPAFTEEELNELLGWVRGGGALLLSVDHTPWAGASSGLLALLGIQVFDGQVQETAAFGQLDEEALAQAASDAGVTADWIRQRIGRPGELGTHPIVEGRNESEQVRSVWTFNGSAFYPARNVQPLLTLGPDASGITALILNWPVTPTEGGGLVLQRPGSPPDTIAEEDRPELIELLMPRFSMAGWLHGAAIQFGEGRVVALADATMCTAQLFGTSKMGMNAPLASDNPQFCLNVMHWLSGLLSD